MRATAHAKAQARNGAFRALGPHDSQSRAPRQLAERSALFTDCAGSVRLVALPSLVRDTPTNTPECTRHPRR